MTMNTLFIAGAHAQGVSCLLIQRQVIRDLEVLLDETVTHFELLAHACDWTRYIRTYHAYHLACE